MARLLSHYSVDAAPPEIVVKTVSCMCAVKHNLAKWPSYALFLDRPHFALFDFCVMQFAALELDMLRTLT